MTTTPDPDWIPGVSERPKPRPKCPRCGVVLTGDDRGRNCPHCHWRETPQPLPAMLSLCPRCREIMIPSRAGDWCWHCGHGA